MTLNGGSLTANNSFVTLANNNTATFNGNQITLTDNNNVTLLQSPNVTQTTVTVEGDQNTLNFTAPTSTFYQVVTTAASGCRNYANLEAQRATNLSISSVSYTRITFTSSSIDAPSSDWSLSPDSSTLQFNGDNSGNYAYELRLCLQSGELYGPSPVGQRVVLALYNITTGTPVLLGQPGASALLFNHTNPAFLGGVCTETVVQQVFTNNRFGAYAAIEHTDASSATGLLAVSTYTMLALPLACKGNTININITANFNGSQLEAGPGIALVTVSADTLRIDNTGVLSIQITDALQDPSHDREYFWQHAWHKLKELALGSTSTLAGALVFDDSTVGAATIKPRHTTGGHFQWQLTCPLDCGSDPIETDGQCSCGRVTAEGPIVTNDTCSCPQGVSASNGTCDCENGVTSEGPIETSDECHCAGGVTTESTCNCNEVSTNTIDSPTGLPINFPSGATFGPRTPVTIVFDPQQPSLSSISTSSSSSSGSSSSSSSSSPSAGEPSVPGIPGGGGCSPASLLLKPGAMLEGYDKKTGKKLYILGSALHSVAHSVSHAASSAAGDATGAAGAATSAATSVVAAITGLLCHGGGVPIPQTLGGLPGVPSSGSLPNLNDPASITGAAVSAAFSTPSTTSVPDPTTLNAALAAAIASVTGAQLPANGPTSIVVNTGGFQLPVFNNSLPLPTCGGTDRGDIGLITGNSTTDDRLIVCANKPSLDGYAYYDIPTTNAVVSAIFRGNGTGILCLPSDNWCEIDAYPNGTLFALRPTQKITPGSCTFCTLTWDSAGDIVEATSGNISLYNSTASFVNASQYYTDSQIAMDSQSSLINAGYTVLNQTLVTDMNITDRLLRPIKRAAFNSPFSGSANCTGAQLCYVSAAVGACNFLNIDPCVIPITMAGITTSSIATVTLTGGYFRAMPVVYDYAVDSLRILMACDGNTLCSNGNTTALSFLIEVFAF